MLTFAMAHPYLATIIVCYFFAMIESVFYNVFHKGHKQEESHAQTVGTGVHHSVCGEEPLHRQTHQYADQPKT